MLDTKTLKEASPVRKGFRSQDDFYTAIHQRIYTLSVTGEDEKTVLVKLTSKDSAPSGYTEADTHLVHLDNVRIRKDKLSGYPTPDHLLAKLAFDHDKDLDHMTGCQHHNASRKAIKKLLGDYAHTPPPTVDI